MHQNNNGLEIRQELQSLQSELNSLAQDYQTTAILSLPSLQDQIASKWLAEAKIDTADHTSWWQEYKEAFLKWNYNEKGSDWLEKRKWLLWYVFLTIIAILIISFVAGCVINFHINSFEIGFLWFRIIFIRLSLISSPTLIFLPPAWKSFSTFRQAKAITKALRLKKQAELNDKLAMLENDPIFLTSEIEKYLDDLLNKYRESILMLEGKFKNSVIKPRDTAKRSLKSLQEDKKEILDMSEGSLFAKEAILQQIDIDISEYEAIIATIQPNEQQLITLFKELKDDVNKIDVQLASMGSFRIKHKTTRQLLDRIASHGANIKAIKIRQNIELDKLGEYLLGIKNNLNLMQRSLENFKMLMPILDSFDAGIEENAKKLPPAQHQMKRVVRA